MEGRPLQLLIVRHRGLITSASNAATAIRAGLDRFLGHFLMSKAAFPLYLLFFAAVIFWKIILTKEYTILSYPDSSWQSYPWFQYIAQNLHRGSFPFWDPFTFGGRSFVGEAQTGAFYPLNVGMGLLPLNARGLLPVSVIEGFLVFHCFLASLFTYFLARHLRLPRFSAFVSGVVFAYSGSIGVRAFGQINVLYSATWLPVVFLCYLKSLQAMTWRRRLFLANLSGLALALCLLGGHHQPFIYCSIAVAFTALLLWFFPPKISRDSPCETPRRATIPVVTLCLFLFAFAYSSIQVFPSLEYSTHAYRWVGGEEPVLANGRIPYSIGSTLGKLPPQGLLDLVFPYIAEVENSPYFGILPILFVLLSISQIKKSKVVQICLALAFLFLTLSLADITPLHGIFYFMVPGFNQTRAASRNLLVVHLAMSLLAGVGCTLFLHSISKKERAWHLRTIQTFGAFSLVLTLLVIAAYFYRSQVLYLPTNYDPFFFACFLMLISTALALARFFGVLRFRLVKVAVIALCLFDFHYLLSAHIKTKSAFDGRTNYEPSQYYREDGVLQFLRSQPGTFRADFRGDNYPKNIGEVYRLETLNGHGATAPKQFMDLVAAGNFGLGRVSDLYNVKYVVSTEDLSLPKVFEERTTKVYENRTCLPRAWLVSSVIAKKNPEQVLPSLLDPVFDPRQAALVDDQSDGSLLASTESRYRLMGASSGDVHFEAHGPNRFTVFAETPEPAFLVISENWDPGWRADINRVPSSPVRADGALIGIQLGPGRSRVDFHYYPKGMYWALVLVGLAATALAYTGLEKQSGPEPASELPSASTPITAKLQSE
jgi:hypothetical protein